MQFRKNEGMNKMDTILNESKLKAGAAQIDITPRIGTQLDGDLGYKRPAEVVFEPLYAKALVLESGNEKVCIISLDLTAITKEWGDKIRLRTEQRYGILKENVMVHALQNHAATSLGHIMVTETNNLLPEGDDWAWAKGGDDNYILFAVEKILDVIGEAIGKLQAVNIGICRGIDGRFAFNRRYVMRDGTSQMLPDRCNEEILHIEGPSDPEVGVALITNDNLENIAVLLHHTCHPVHGNAMNYITSGWPGAWSECMRDRLGSNCVPIVLNGCCGNVFHDNRLDPTYIPYDYKGMGKGLAEASIKALKKLKYISNPALLIKNKHLEIPIREISEEELEKARQILKDHPMPKLEETPKWDDIKWDKNEKRNSITWDWFYAMSTIDLYNHFGRNAKFDYEIQAFKIGDLAIVALGGEPFVEGQLKIKLESPAPYTFLAHMCNYYVGYIPTKEAFNRGGYETCTGIASKLHEDALDMIADASIVLLQDLFR